MTRLLIAAGIGALFSACIMFGVGVWILTHSYQQALSLDTGKRLPPVTIRVPKSGDLSDWRQSAPHGTADASN